MGKLTESRPVRCVNSCRKTERSVCAIRNGILFVFICGSVIASLDVQTSLVCQLSVRSSIDFSRILVSFILDCYVALSFNLDVKPIETTARRKYLGRPGLEVTRLGAEFNMETTRLIMANLWQGNQFSALLEQAYQQRS